MPLPSTTTIETMKISTERYKYFGKTKNSPNPITESFIESKILENLHHKQPVNIIKILFEVQFHNQINPKGFLVK